MADNKLKISRRNTFTFEGYAIVNDNTFTINKARDDGKWVHSSLNMGIDCGPDHGVNYVSLMGGYDPTRENIIYLSTIDESGKILGKEHQLQISWDDRFSLTDDDFEKISSTNVINTYIEKGSDGKTINKKFISSYDAISYIKEHITDKSVVRVSGHIEYRPSNGDTGEWYSSQIIDTITLKDEKNLIYRATAKLVVLTGKDTMLSPNVEEKTIPLIFQTLTYVRNVNGKKYNQTCAIPIKAIFDYSQNPALQGENAGKYLDAIKKKYFSCEKKDYVNEIVMNFYYRGGVKKVTATIEDLPQDIQIGIQLGVIDAEQALGALSVGGPAQKDLVFHSVEMINKEKTGDDGVAVKILETLETPCKYLVSELLTLEELEPISNEVGVTAPVDTTIDIDDEKVNEEVNNILSLFGNIN